MKILKIAGWILLSLVGLFILFLLFSTLADYKPGERILISEAAAPDTITTSGKLTFLLWNIGYCGLGKEMDFFYDGGNQVRASRENTLRNLQAVRQFLAEHDSVHFFLLQEVDVRSKRTYRINEVDSLADALPNHTSFFATNYQVHFVPVPPASPMGRVKSGLLTLSGFTPSSSVRFNFPGDYSWPTNLFMLDRCFLVNRYPLANGKELLVLNSHNSAFDDGSLKQQEMEYLRDFLLDESGKGNYIIVGADWNQNPPGFSPKVFSEELRYERFLLHAIDKGFLPPGWQWIYYPAIPSNRNLEEPYDPLTSTLTILDFYLLSPNLRAEKVVTIDLSFENTDHQPVLLTLEFVPE